MIYRATLNSHPSSNSHSPRLDFPRIHKPDHQIATRSAPLHPISNYNPPHPQLLPPLLVQNPQHSSSRTYLLPTSAGLLTVIHDYSMANIWQTLLQSLFHSTLAAVLIKLAHGSMTFGWSHLLKHIFYGLLYELGFYIARFIYPPDRAQKGGLLLALLFGCTAILIRKQVMGTNGRVAEMWEAARMNTCRRLGEEGAVFQTGPARPGLGEPEPGRRYGRP